MSFPFRPASIVLCALLLGCSSVSAQPHHAPETTLTVPSEASVVSLRSHTTMDAVSSSLHLSARVSPPPHSSSSFGQALLGSSLGLAIGGPLGVLMIRGAADDSAWEDARENKDNCCGLQRFGVGLLGAGAIVGSGPLGAAQRLGKSGASVYAPSITLELVLGSIGYGLGSELGRTDRQKRILSVAVGLPLAAVGAALGAVLANPESSSAHAALNVNEGRWSIGVPQIRLQPQATVDRAPVVHVSLLSAEL